VKKVVIHPNQTRTYVYSDQAVYGSGEGQSRPVTGHACWYSNVDEQPFAQIRDRAIDPHLSDDLVRVEEGSLHPALQRLELNVWITAEWDRTGHL
jgi:hypothetical protein